VRAWGVQWRSVNRLDGKSERLIWTPLFHTRRECRRYIEERYGYIRQRPDLRAEPHGWRMPRAVRVLVLIAEPPPEPPGEEGT